MSYHVDYDETQRILRGRFEGRVGDGELRQFYREIAKFVAQTNPLAAIVDMTAVTSLDVPPDTIRELANSPPAFPDPDRPRVLIAQATAVFGIARMFELQGQASRPNLHVVRTEKEAMAILGVVELKFEPVELK